MAASGRRTTPRADDNLQVIWLESPDTAGSMTPIPAPLAIFDQTPCPTPAFDFNAKLKPDEELLWTDRGRQSQPLDPVPIGGGQPARPVSRAGLPAQRISSRNGAGFPVGIGDFGHRPMVLSRPCSDPRPKNMPFPISRSSSSRTDRSGACAAPIFQRQRSAAMRRNFMPSSISENAMRSPSSARSKSIPQAYPPVFVGVDESLHVAELAAETFKLKLIKR